MARRRGKVGFRFNAEDVVHIAGFREGAFKSWSGIVGECRLRRLEEDTESLLRANQALALTFD